MWVRNGTPQHLIATADPPDRDMHCQLFDCGFQTVLPHPAQIPHRIFAARQKNHIRLSQFLHRRNIAHGHTLQPFKHVKIRKIGDPWKTDHCQIYHAYIVVVQLAAQTVLILNGKMHIWNYAGNLHTAAFLQHLHSRIKDRLVPTEFINNQTLHTGFFILFQKHQRSQKLRKHAATVDIPNQKHRCIDQFCQPHIDNIIRFQIDLCRASRPFHHNNVCLLFQLRKSLADRRNQLFLIRKIIPRPHISEHLTLYDHL